MATPLGKEAFLRMTKKGDFVITTGPPYYGLVGHAAILATDDYVLEMPGVPETDEAQTRGKGEGGEDNNRKIKKDEWYDLYKERFITVYRCPDSAAAIKSADWAYKNYWNPNLGEEKTIHIAYSVVSPLAGTTDPSYCSKLVTQSFSYGGEVFSMSPIYIIPIPPSAIPSFFGIKDPVIIVGSF